MSCVDYVIQIHIMSISILSPHVHIVILYYMHNYLSRDVYLMTNMCTYITDITLNGDVVINYHIMEAYNISVSLH